MHVLTIIWALFCATLILGYPMYLLHKSSRSIEDLNKPQSLLKSDTIELISFEVSHLMPGWSFKLDVPQITEEVLQNNPILFYLESSDSCLKLPFNNGAMGYSANIYKNVGRVYVTFKSLVDGVSNFYIPSWHINKLKIMVVRTTNLKGESNIESKKAAIYKALQKAKININNYEEVLEHLSNIVTIDFKGHSINRVSKAETESNTVIQPRKVSKLYTAI
nr:hypothetical protein [uncultured Allomuricauda sp.]